MIPVTGKQRTTTRTFHGKVKAADKALRAMVGEVETGTHGGAGSTVGHLLDRWLEQITSKVAPHQTREYRRLIDKTISGARSGDVAKLGVED